MTLLKSKSYHALCYEPQGYKYLRIRIWTVATTIEIKPLLKQITPTVVGNDFIRKIILQSPLK